MDGNVAQDERTEFEMEPLEAGSTAVLTDAGWETALYVDPGDDWVRQDDGSYLSPDGRTWSFPPTAH
jgi:hypothetical protein